MIKGMKQAWKKPKKNLGVIWKKRLVGWRKEDTVTRVERPTRPDRAHTLGYKAKQGFVIARAKVMKGKRKRQKPAGGRIPKKAGRFFSAGKSNQILAEERAARKFPNLEVLNSYYVGEDGQHAWFEVILVDPSHPSIAKDSERGWLAEKQHRGRVFRSLTSRGKRMRGLRKS